METLRDRLRSIGACKNAIEWVGERTPERAWQECERADWMLWLLAKMVDVDGWPGRVDVVRTAADCAEAALRYVPDGEDRPRRAIESARAWADNPCDETLSSAHADARAAYAAYAANTAYAAYAAQGQMAEMIRARVTPGPVEAI